MTTRAFLSLPALVLASAVALLATPELAQAQACPTPPELGGPLISGTTAWVNGTLVWTDYAYDDRGANTNAIFGGDESYPANPYPGNTADFIQLHVGTGGGGALSVTAVLETLVDDADAAIGIGLDTDQNSQTGAPSVPGGLWTPAASLGLEHMLLLDSAAGVGTLFSWQLGAWQTVGVFPIAVDRACNTIGAEVALLTPGTATWNVVGLAGWSDGAGSWANGAHPLYDLAFVVGEDPVTDPALSLYQQIPQIYQPWQDNIQSDILAGTVDPAPAIVAVEFGTGLTQLNPAVDVTTPGIYTFMYHSAIDMGEGVRQSPLQFAGPYQPYVVYIPQAVTQDPPPALIYMHGANQNHLVNSVHFSLDGVAISGAYDVPAVVVMGLGRDTDWSTGPAEQDLLEWSEDATVRLGLDRERLVLTGISAGGIGTFRHAARYPDRWSGAYSIVGYGTTDLTNMSNLPLRFHNGSADPLVNAALWALAWQAADAAGTVDYSAVLVNSSSHIPEEGGNCWYLEMIDEPRVTNPARVQYTVRPASFSVDPVVGLDLRPRGAYWVSEMVSNDAQPASVDATNLLRADRLRVASDFNVAEESVSAGRDFCGPNPAYQTGDQWQKIGRALTVGAAQPIEKKLQATLTNLAAVTFDLAHAGLVPPSATLGDWDGDGVVDAVDNCPFEPNSDQADNGGMATATPNGVGDACECGDVTGNGQVNGQDGTAIRRHGLGIEPNPSFRIACNCDVSGNGECNGIDGTAVKREALGLTPNPVFANACPSFTGARRVEIQTDVPSDVTLAGMVQGTQVALDGVPLGSADANGSFTASVPTGAHTLLLLP